MPKGDLPSPSLDCLEGATSWHPGGTHCCAAASLETAPDTDHLALEIVLACEISYPILYVILFEISRVWVSVLPIGKKHQKIVQFMKKNPCVENMVSPSVPCLRKLVSRFSKMCWWLKGGRLGSKSGNMWQKWPLLLFWKLLYTGNPEQWKTSIIALSKTSLNVLNHLKY